MKIEEIIGKIKLLHEERGITLFPRASEKMIDEFEERLSLRLPDDIKTFYRFSNGMENEEEIFSIIPLDEIAGSMRQFRENTFFIAEYMVYSETWAVEVSEGDHNRYSIFLIDEERKQVILTHSFAEFLDRYLKGGVTKEKGLNDWHKEIKNRKK